MLAKYHSPRQIFVHDFAVSSIVESSLVTSLSNHDGRIMPSNHVQQNPGLHTTLKPAVKRSRKKLTFKNVLSGPKYRGFKRNFRISNLNSCTVCLFVALSKTRWWGYELVANEERKLIYIRCSFRMLREQRSRDKTTTRPYKTMKKVSSRHHGVLFLNLVGV